MGTAMANPQRNVRARLKSAAALLLPRLPRLDGEITVEDADGTASVTITARPAGGESCRPPPEAPAMNPLLPFLFSAPELLIVRAVAASERPINRKALATRVGAVNPDGSPSTQFKILLPSLVDRGVLTQEDDGGYRVAEGLLALVPHISDRP